MATSTSTPPQPGQRVRVVADAYGTYLGREGTVVPTPPEMATVHSVDLTGTVWVALDGWGLRDIALGYAPPTVPGFDPEELEVLT